MNIFILLYLLPLVLSMVIIYYAMKQEGETVGEFVSMLPVLFIPLVNIGVFLLTIVYFANRSFKFDEKWEDFKNKKL